MNGDIPGVPIITLTGTQSLSDPVKEVNIAQPLPATEQSQSLFPNQAVSDYTRHSMFNPTPETVHHVANALFSRNATDIELKSSVFNNTTIEDNSMNEPLFQLLLQQNSNLFSQTVASPNSGYALPQSTNRLHNQVTCSENFSMYSPLPPFAPEQPLYSQPNHIHKGPPLMSNSSPMNGDGSHTVAQNSNKTTMSSPAQGFSAPSSVEMLTRSEDGLQNASSTSSCSNHQPSSVIEHKPHGKEIPRGANVKLDRMDGNEYSTGPKMHNSVKEEFSNSSLSDRIKRTQRKRQVSSYAEYEEDEEHYINKKTRFESNWDAPDRESSDVFIPNTVEEMLDSMSYKKFGKALDKVILKTEDLDIKSLDTCEDVTAYDTIVNRIVLADLCNESAKLKGMGATKQVTPGKLIKVLTILLLPLKMGSKLQPIKYTGQDDEREEALWRDLLTDKVLMAVDAALTATHVMTSDDMPKGVYIEDVIERIVSLLKVQLTNTIYPEYDPVYRVTGIISNMKQRRARAGSVTHRGTLSLYNKLAELISDLAELVNIQDLPDTIILHIASVAVSPFFVENIGDLQLAALKLVTSVFAKYESLRHVVIEEILASLARLPSSKKNIRNYVVQGEDRIQMVTALVLELIQSVVTLPKIPDGRSSPNHNKCSLPDKELQIKTSYEKSKITASQFLQVFLQKCTTKGNEDQDYRPLFENFIQDLLLVVNKPQWPAAEMMLCILGNILVNHFSNKSIDMTMRTASLDYLGTVAARLRRDAVNAQSREETLDSILQRLQDTDEDTPSPLVYPQEDTRDDAETVSAKKKKKKKKKKKHRIESDDENDEEADSGHTKKYEADRTQELQKALLDFLVCNMQLKPALKFARQFYVAQWINDAAVNMKKNVDELEKQQKHASEDVNFDSSVMDRISNVIQQCEQRKSYLLDEVDKKIDLPGTIGRKQTKLDYSSACLVTRYLASNRPFSQSFDKYLFNIITVAQESAVAVRTKAIKCLGSVVEADPNVLARPEVHNLVKARLLDQSTSVREAVVDLLGRFILVRPHLIPQYYPVLSDRILDTGVSVRKRVIKIFRDICLEHPEFEKIPEICVKMIRRVNDEDGIKKLVNEVFQNMWLTPTDRRDHSRMVQKVVNIVDVVAACNATGFEWFEQLLVNLLKKEESKQAELACVQIVDSLVENVINLQAEKESNQRKLTATFQTLHLICKANPELLVNHITSIAYYLSSDLTPDDQTMLMSVIRIIEQVVPLLKHPNPNFLATIEENLVKLLSSGSTSIMQACSACLASCVKNVTHNYALVKDLFERYYGMLMRMQNAHKQLAFKDIFKLYRPICAVGAICQHFDMTKEPLSSDSQLHRKVFDLLFFFVQNVHDDREEVNCRALSSIGWLCVRHAEFMRESALKTFYLTNLSSNSRSDRLRVRILNNLFTYLQEEENRMYKEQAIWKNEDLKELGDVQSGMASAIVQLFIKDILSSLLSLSPHVRSQALKVVVKILKQGLIHPAQCIPFLVAMGTDQEQINRAMSENYLKEFESNHPQLFHMKVKDGFKLSYKLQKIVNGARTIRGVYKDSHGMCTARNHFLYNLVKSSRQSRRAFISNILKHFDDSNTADLSELVYFADNLAHFPYQVLDEPLFIMHNIDMTVSVVGSSLLQCFREVFKMSETEEVDLEAEDLFAKLPENCISLQQVYMACQGCLLLLVLKQHLKDMYGLTDAKIQRYSPNENAKVYDKPFTKKTEVVFNPVQALKLVQSGPPKCDDEESRKSLLLAYINFKQLMMSIDAEEDISDSTGTKPTTATLLNASYTSTNVVDESVNSAIINVSNFPNTPSASKSNTPGSKKSRRKLPPHLAPSSTKKKKKKKKKKASRFSSSEESSDSDPDFLG